MEEDTEEESKEEEAEESSKMFGGLASKRQDIDDKLEQHLDSKRDRISIQSPPNPGRSEEAVALEKVEVMVSRGVEGVREAWTQEARQQEERLEGKVKRLAEESEERHMELERRVEECIGAVVGEEEGVRVVEQRCAALKRELEQRLNGVEERGTGSGGEEWRVLKDSMENERRKGEEELRGEMRREVEKLRGEVAEVRAVREGSRERGREGSRERGREGKREEQRRGLLEDKFQVKSLLFIVKKAVQRKCITC